MLSRYLPRTVRATALALAVAHAFVAHTAPIAQMAAPDSAPLAIAARTALEGFREARRPIELTLSRPLIPEDGELVVLAGSLDVSALSTLIGTTLRINPGAFAFPSGESQLVVLLKQRGKFSQVATIPIRILDAAGFVKQSVIPSIELGSTGQVADGHSKSLQLTQDSRRQNITLSAGLRSTHERTRLTLESQSNVVGAGREEQALRFSQRGDDAPLVDLSSYVLSMRSRAARLEAGHVSIGTNRHLVSAFSSRGIALSAGPTWAQLSVGSLAGAPIVGWDNVIGFAETNHRINTASLGLELLRQRPGGLQLRFSGLDGSLLPRAGFTQGAITDAEASRGGGVELAAATPGQRVRFSAGYTVSTFENPARDTQLIDGIVVGKSAKDRRTARYVEGAVGIVQGAKLFGRLSTQWTLGLRHERVDPLFRSVGVSTQADREQTALDLNGSLGAMTLSGGLTRGRDNLAAVSSLLTSRTDGLTGSAAFGLASLLGITQHTLLLPQLTFAYSAMHQYADGAPGSSDFRPRDLADQFNTTFDAGAQWQIRSWRAAVRSNRNRLDNRQPERERADFSGSTVNVSIGRAFGSNFDAGLEGSVELQRNEELVQVNSVRRTGTTIAMRPTSLTSISTNITLARTRTPPATHNITNMEMFVEVSQGLRLFGKNQPARIAQALLRFSRSSVTLLPFDAEGNALPLATQVRWTLNTGLSLRLW